jgi:hypothetical protein
MGKGTENPALARIQNALKFCGRGWKAGASTSTASNGLEPNQLGTVTMIDY